MALNSEISKARKAAGLSQEALAARAGVDRTTVVKLEAGGGATLQTLKDVGRCLGLELHFRPMRNSAVKTLDDQIPRSRAWKLSFPYDWSNPKISEDALITSVLKDARLSDVARVCYVVGIDRVERVLKEKVNDPYVTSEATRVLSSVRNGFELAKQSIPANSNARVT